MSYSERHRHKRIKRLCIFSACCIGLGALTGSLITGSVMKKDIRTVKVSEKESQVIYGTKADVVDTDLMISAIRHQMTISLRLVWKWMKVHSVLSMPYQKAMGSTGLW